MSEQQRAKDEFWKANCRLILGLLAIWFVVPIFGGIVFVDFFNQFRMGGYKLGFWIAQQGSIYLFVVLIIVYVRRISKLEQTFADGLKSHKGDAS